MAILRQRLRRLNAEGSYDIVHLETSTPLVIRPDGSNLEEILQTLVEIATGSSSGDFMGDYEFGELEKPEYNFKLAFQDISSGEFEPITDESTVTYEFIDLV